MSDHVIENADIYQRATLKTATRWLACVGSAPSILQAEKVFTDRWPEAMHGDGVRRAVKAAVGSGMFSSAMPGVLSQAIVAASRQYSALARIPGVLPVAFDVATSTIPMTISARGQRAAPRSRLGDTSSTRRSP